MALAQEAIAGNPDDSSVLRSAGHALGFWSDYDRALAVLEKAARLNVNGSQVLNSLGWVKCYACVEPDQAIAHFERAIRLSPRDSEMVHMLNGIAHAHLTFGCAERACYAETAPQGRRPSPRLPIRSGLRRRHARCERPTQFPPKALVPVAKAISSDSACELVLAKSVLILSSICVTPSMSRSSE